MPRIITYTDAQILLRTVLYKPLASVQWLAAAYDDLEGGVGLAFYHAVRQLYQDGGQVGMPPMPEQRCAVADVPATEPQETPHEEDAYSAIICSDGAPLDEMGVDDFEKYVDKLKSVSWWAGAASIAFLLPCVGRKVRPEWRVVPAGV
jgi:hypothetical protein